MAPPRISRIGRIFRISRISRIGWTLAAALAGCPAAHAPPPARGAAACRVAVAPDRLRRDVEALALGFLPRTFDHPENLDRAAFYRNARYHTPGDRPETLDYRRMAEVVAGVRCAIGSLARRAP